jgi:hypothetical protein
MTVVGDLGVAKVTHKPRQLSQLAFLHSGSRLQAEHNANELQRLRHSMLHEAFA